MIAVVVVGILASIAYPSYLQHVAQARRNEAASALLSGAQALERYYTANGRYTTAAGGDTLPAVYPSQVPENGSAYYVLGPSGTPSANSFTLQASRRGAMAADACGDFTIDETGRLALANRPATSSKTLADCWRR